MPKVDTAPKPATKQQKAVSSKEKGLSVKAAATLLGVTRQMVMKYIASGALPAIQRPNIFSPTGKAWFVLPEEVDKFKTTYISSQESSGFGKGLPRTKADLKQRSKHPLLVLQHKLRNAEKQINNFKLALQREFPERDKKTRQEYRSLVAALENYLTVTTPTTPHVNPKNLEIV